jgi:hypothetical protein
MAVILRSGIFGLQECGGYPGEGMPEQRYEGCVYIRALVEDNEGLRRKKMRWLDGALSQNGGKALSDL